MDDVDLNTNMFIRIYRSFLSSGGELEIDQIIKPFIEMQPFLHSKAAMNTIDVGAFIYSLLRLPDQIFNINSVILSQSMRSIKREGFESDNWKESPAPARRRKMYTQDEDLFVIINSVTDVDDLVCLLTSFQIEWNKINSILNLNSKDSDEAISTNNSEWLSRILGNSEVIEKLGDIKRVELFEFFRTIKSKKMQFKVTQLRGSYIDYSKSGADWFENIIAKTNKKDFTKRPIYFISSNTHSIVNNITGFVNEKEDELVKFMREKNMSDLLEFWEGLNDKEI
ncbi:MAG TPA: hypothetical protein VGA67_03175, partial [Candidatus Dojkabacteria bacterium]